MRLERENLVVGVSGRDNQHGAALDNLTDLHLSDNRIQKNEHVCYDENWGRLPNPWQFIRSVWEPSAQHILTFDDHSANKTLPADTGKVRCIPISSPTMAWASRTSMTKSCVLRQHARQQGADERAEALSRHPHSCRQEGPHETPYLRMACRVARDGHRLEGVPADLLGIHPEEVQAQPGGQLDRRDPRRQRPFHQRAMPRYDGRHSSRVTGMASLLLAV